MRKRTLVMVVTAAMLISMLCLGPTVQAAVPGQDIVNYAKEWIGTPYVWGGTNLSSGVDCSGFVCRVYEHFGINLWGRRTGLRRLVDDGVAIELGTDLSLAEPGDIVTCNDGAHVVIYAGNGQVVQASSKHGVCESPATKAWLGNVISIIRIQGVSNTGAAAATIQPGLYSLAPMCATGRRLDVKDGSTVSGTNVQIWRSNDTAAQQWNIAAVGNGYYTLISQESGKALDVANAKTAQGTNVQQCNLNGNYAQHWRFTDAGDGYYYITTRLNDNMRLDVNEKEDANGANVQIWSSNNSTAQKWKLIPVSPGKLTHTHQKGAFQFNEASHPHYGYYACSLCGVNFTDGSTTTISGCTQCRPTSVAVGVTSSTSGQQTARGTGAAAQRFVDMAVSQIGKKRVDYGYTVSWCGYFAGWCSQQLGFESIIPPVGAQSANGVTHYKYIINHGGSGVRFYNDRSDMQQGTYLTDRNAYTPQVGDIVILSWGSKAPAGHLYIDHVAIVQKVANGRIYVVHGNYHSSKVSGGIVCGPGCSVCGGESWPLDSEKIYAYARPNWAGVSAEESASSPSAAQEAPRVTEYFDCDVVIYTTEGQAVNAYANILDSVRKNWFDRGQTLLSQRGAKVSDGSTWYQVRAVNAKGEQVTLWVNVNVPGVTVENRERTPNCDSGHTWGAWEVTRTASCERSGLRRRTCSVCGENQEETVEALGHDYRVDREFDTAIDYVCKNCGDRYREPKEPPVVEGNKMDNFVPQNQYVNGMFRDVKPGDWFYKNVITVYELGLMKGTGEGAFSPGNNVTVAEAIALAARLHSIYNTGRESIPNYDGGNWYDPYVNYARSNGLISENYLYTSPATREEFVHILAQALPKVALDNVAGQITFADEESIVYIGDVKLLSGAGVINGVRENGETYFKPTATITRAEVTAIVGRMAQADSRVRG